MRLQGAESLTSFSQSCTRHPMVKLNQQLINHGRGIKALGQCRILSTLNIHFEEVYLSVSQIVSDRCQPFYRNIDRISSSFLLIKHGVRDVARDLRRIEPHGTINVRQSELVHMKLRW